MSVTWELDRALKIGDEAVGGSTLRDLYAKMRAAPVDVDLKSLWRELGVSVKDEKVVFDDKAPLARIRRGITPTGP
jgi:hypothetical protein